MFAAPAYYSAAYWPAGYWSAPTVALEDIISAIEQRFSVMLATAFGQTLTSRRLWSEMADAGTPFPHLTFLVLEESIKQERPDGIIWEWIVEFEVHGAGRRPTMVLSNLLRNVFRRFQPNFTIGYATTVFRPEKQEPVPRIVKGVGKGGADDWQQKTRYVVDVFEPFDS